MGSLYPFVVAMAVTLMALIGIAAALSLTPSIEQPPGEGNSEEPVMPNLAHDKTPSEQGGASA